MKISKAEKLLKKAISPHGFVASIEQKSNYNRVWARDGVICCLAGLLTEDQELINASKTTLTSLADYQHKHGQIPSNIDYSSKSPKISYGGLAGRVDTLAWFIIGCCQFTYITDDITFFKNMKPSIEKCINLMEIWEFNNKHLMYVPRGGNWADEYITQAYTLYDQCLRLWALKLYNYQHDSPYLKQKIKYISNTIKINYKKKNIHHKNAYHPIAYDKLNYKNYLAASFEPAGYQDSFDAFGNALAILTNVEDQEDTDNTFNYCERLRKEMPCQLLPAFWPEIKPQDKQWHLLQDHYSYTFRNEPYHFHNAGIWPVVNAFYALSISETNPEVAGDVLEKIKEVNALEGHSFREYIHGRTGHPQGLRYCSWSAAGELILEKQLMDKKNLTL